MITSRMAISHSDGDIVDLFETGAKTSHQKATENIYSIFLCLMTKLMINKAVLHFSVIWVVKYR